MGTTEEKLSTEEEEDATERKHRCISMSVGLTDIDTELSVAKASLAQATNQLEKNESYIESLKAELEKVKGGEVSELNVLKESLANAAQELEKKDEYIESLKAELAKTREMGASELGVVKESLSKKLERKEEHVEALRAEVSTTKEELERKDAQVEALKAEVGKLKEVESKLAGTAVSLSKLRRELIRVKTSETHAMDLLAEGMKRIEELEAEVEKSKEFEVKLMDSFVDQTKQLEQTLVSLEESKLEKKSLLRKLEKMGVSADEEYGYLNSPQSCTMDGELETLNSELQLANDMISQCLKKEKLMLHEITSLKNEVKTLSEAEENSKKALDDLVVALQEVSTEAKQAKEKLALAEGKIETLKQDLRKAEDDYLEAKREADTQMNTSDRLRLEVEESLIAWNEKEAGFVECIKRAVEERDEAQECHNKAKDEIQKLRDILNEALNESNVAKESAGIAIDENSQLKDELAQKDEALNYISQENESLKVSEVVAHENITELKRLLDEGKTKDGKKLKPQESADKEQKEDKETEKQKDDREHVKHRSGWKLLPSLSFMESRKTSHSHNKEPVEEHKNEEHGKQAEKLKKQDSADSPKDDSREQEHKQNDDREQKPNNSGHLGLHGLKIPNKQKEGEDQKSWNLDGDEDEDEGSDLLKGSIFDVAETPEAKKGSHHRKKSSFSSLDFDEAMKGDYLDNLDGAHFDDLEDERNTRRKRALLRRFGDLIRMRGYYSHRKEASMDRKEQASVDKKEQPPADKKEPTSAEKGDLLSPTE